MREGMVILAQIVLGWGLIMASVVPMTILALGVGMSKQDWIEYKNTLVYILASFLLGKMAWEAFVR